MDGFRLLKILGLISILGYMIVFLSIWIYHTEINNYIYIQVGEPNLFIKYSEWIFGLLGITVMIPIIKKELDGVKL